MKITDIKNIQKITMLNKNIAEIYLTNSNHIRYACVIGGIIKFWYS